jgi:hypothetical protein
MVVRDLSGEDEVLKKMEEAVMPRQRRLDLSGVPQHVKIAKGVRDIIRRMLMV